MTGTLAACARNIDGNRPEIDKHSTANFIGCSLGRYRLVVNQDFRRPASPSLPTIAALFLSSFFPRDLLPSGL
jgi:hypothetical protein